MFASPTRMVEGARKVCSCRGAVGIHEHYICSMRLCVYGAKIVAAELLYLIQT
jgi:hypothetical protein